MARFFDFQIADDPEVAYLRFSNLDETRVVGKTISLRDLIRNYNGPDIFFDFDREENLIGLEFLL